MKSDHDFEKVALITENEQYKLKAGNIVELANSVLQLPNSAELYPFPKGWRTDVYHHRVSGMAYAWIL